MSLEQLLHEQLSEATRDVIGGPDLETAVRAGQRRRTARAALLGGGTAAAVVAATFGVASVVGGPAATPPAPDRLAAAEPPSYADYVAGTDTDEALQAAITGLLPGLTTADDVYPSDWTRDTPLPDARWADATDWQAFYEVAPGQTFRLIMGYQKPADAMPGTGQVETASYSADGVYTYTTMLVRNDGFVVNAIEKVEAGSQEQADAARALDAAAIADLVQDPALTFDAPAAWPH